MSSSTTTITSPADIPTLSDLWSSQELRKDNETKIPHDDQINKRVSIWRGDITKLKVDMIVNAANGSLMGGGGVDGAIHAAAGRGLLAECELFGGADTGETRITGGYDLPARMIAHTVGPVYRSEKDPAAMLRSCYGSSMYYCNAYGGDSIAFSSISTGIYGYPMGEAIDEATFVVRKCLENPKYDSITRVIFVVFSAKDEKKYREMISHQFPPPNDWRSEIDDKVEGDVKENHGKGDDKKDSKKEEVKKADAREEKDDKEVKA